MAEFPLCLECRLLHTLKIGLHTLFVGEIVDVKADEEVLVDGIPAICQVNPLVFSVGEQAYYAVGDRVGTAFQLGRDLLRPS